MIPTPGIKPNENARPWVAYVAKLSHGPLNCTYMTARSGHAVAFDIVEAQVGVVAIDVVVLRPMHT